MQQPDRRIRVLINPTSGAKAGLTTNSVTEDDVRATAERHGFGAEVIVTGSEEESIVAAQDAARSGYFAVVAAGGDGTQAVIASALLDTETALGILPLGSVMNIARMLDLPRDLEAAAAVIAGGHVRTIDAAEANGVVFLEGGSAGLNAALFEQTERLDAGNYSALLDAARLILRYRPARMVVHLDDRVLTTRAFTIIVANGPYLGLGFTVAPDAKLDDGLFDVVIYSRFSRMELVRHFLSIAFGRRRYAPQITVYRSSRVRIESRRPQPCTADTIDIGHTPVNFVTRPGALRVLVPPPAAE